MLATLDVKWGVGVILQLSVFPPSFSRTRPTMDVPWRVLPMEFHGVPQRWIEMAFMWGVRAIGDIVNQDAANIHQNHNIHKNHNMVSSIFSMLIEISIKLNSLFIQQILKDLFRISHMSWN